MLRQKVDPSKYLRSRKGMQKCKTLLQNLTFGDRAYTGETPEKWPVTKNLKQKAISQSTVNKSAVSRELGDDITKHKNGTVTLTK